MWNRRDWAVLGTTAFGTFGLTLSMFWAAPLQAGDAKSLTESIKIPTYTLNTCKITASVIENDQITGAKDNVVLLRAGAVPKLQLVLANTSADTPTDAPIHVEMRASSARDSRGRMMIIRPPVFSEDYNLSLKPGETKTMEIAFDKIATTEGDTLTLTIGQQKLQAATVGMPGTVQFQSDSFVTFTNGLAFNGAMTNNVDAAITTGYIFTGNTTITTGALLINNTMGPDAIQLLRMAVPGNIVAAGTANPKTNQVVSQSSVLTR